MKNNTIESTLKTKNNERIKAKSLQKPSLVNILLDDSCIKEIL